MRGAYDLIALNTASTRRPAALYDLIGLDGAGLVDVGENDAAEYGAQRVGVLGHHDDPDGRLHRAGGLGAGGAGRRRHDLVL